MKEVRLNQAKTVGNEVLEFIVYLLLFARLMPVVPPVPSPAVFGLRKPSAGEGTGGTTEATELHRAFKAQRGVA